MAAHRGACVLQRPEPLDPEFRRHYGMAYYRTTFTVPEGAPCAAV